MAVTKKELVRFLDMPAEMAGERYKAAAFRDGRYISVPAGEAGGANGN